MSLIAVLTPVHAVLIANGSLPPDRLLEIAATPKRDRTPGPRVTWVPGSNDSFAPQAPAMTRAGQLAYIAANPGKAIPKSIATRHASVEAHLWSGATQGTADDYSATEALLGAVVSALRHVGYGAYELLSSGWVNPRGTEGNYLGHRYVLNLAVLVPVLEVQDNPAPLPGELATISTITQTDQIGPIPPGNTTFSSTP